jgi:hypothetical protein
LPLGSATPTEPIVTTVIVIERGKRVKKVQRRGEIGH